MALKHNLPASGDMCVSVLSRLCTVLPSMYRVGVSKVSPTPRAAPGSHKFRGFRVRQWNEKRRDRTFLTQRAARWGLVPSRDRYSGGSLRPVPRRSSSHLSELSPPGTTPAGPPPLPPGRPSRAACPPQLFLKEHLHQLLESMRERVLHLAALTLQRCLRGFLIRRRFRSLRHKIVLLQSRARGYLARYPALPGQGSLEPSGEAWAGQCQSRGTKLPGPEACK